uniref:Uncharacterized protein n=1 Tax=Rhizophora mucronata TaxID=61149 RepID=A0A2P2N7N6_RHIMU
MQLNKTCWEAPPLSIYF